MTNDLLAVPKVYRLSLPIWSAGGVYEMLEDLGYDGTEYLEQREDENTRSLIVETAGRLCYMSFGGGRKTQEHVANLIDSGHGSVLEHVNVGFVFCGVSRTLTHELVRHRAGFAYSQLSQRYVDSGDVRFVLPAAIADLGDEAVVRWCEWVRGCRSAYKLWCELLESAPEAQKLVGTERKKWVRQAARSVLPGCTETRIAVTGNMRAWRWFLEQRGSRFAEPEIRELAKLVLGELRWICADLVADVSVGEDGYIVVGHRKV